MRYLPQQASYSVHESEPSLMKIHYKNADLALLVLRLAVGGLMLFHGIHKARQGFDEGLAPIETMLTAKGLPEALALGVYVGEILAPVLLIVGWLVRTSGLIVAGTMLVSIWLAFGDTWYTLNDQGGLKIELNLLYIAGAVALALSGAGHYRLKWPQRDADHD